MQAFLISFSCVAIESNAAVANERVTALREASRRTGFVPGRGQVRPLTEQEVSRMPEVAHALARAREEARQPYGPPARSGEMIAALVGLTKLHYDDREVAEQMLAAHVSALGYMPSRLARELSQLASSASSAPAEAAP